MEEIWKDIQGYEGLYQVSNYGRVKSTQYWNGTYERILKRGIDQKGYPKVMLCKDGCGRTHLIHRLVAQAFIPNPNNLPQVNHKDEVKTNNHVENLEFCSYQYNHYYGTAMQRLAEKNKNRCSKTVYQYTLDGEFVREWESASEIQRQLGYFQSNISKCCKGKIKQVYNYKWKYA